MTALRVKARYEEKKKKLIVEFKPSRNRKKHKLSESEKYEGTNALEFLMS